MILLKNVPFERQARFLFDNICEYPSNPAFTEAVGKQAIDIARGLKAHQDLLRRIYSEVAGIEGADDGKKYRELLNSTIFMYAMFAGGTLLCENGRYNILINKSGSIKIIDLGQSCRIGTIKTRIQGTPDYIAPEQVKRKTLTPKTDIFNLGATMYWVLTSEKYPTAIRGNDSRGGISLITEPIAPIELNDKIPLSLSKLVMECCCDNPADRPADMKQVGARLAVVQKIWKKHRENVRARLQDDVLPSTEDPDQTAEDDE